MSAYGEMRMANGYLKQYREKLSELLNLDKPCPLLIEEVRNKIRYWEEEVDCARSYLRHDP